MLLSFAVLFSFAHDGETAKVSWEAEWTQPEAEQRPAEQLVGKNLHP